MADDLVEMAINRILDRIADGSFPHGEALPGEPALAAELSVSRPTMREAVRILKDRGVLRVIHGRGTYVAPQHEWVDLPTLVQMTLRTTSPADVGIKLTELRRMVEVGAAGLAARHRTDDHIAAMAALLDEYDAANAEGRVEAVVAADLAFHNAILAASANPFLSAVMRPLEAVLHDSRLLTSSHADVRRRAQVHHRAVFKAIARGDEQAAKDCMRSHMNQTRRDLGHATRTTD